MLSINREIVARHLEAENRHDLAGTLATLHPECVFEDTATGERYIGRDGAADYYRRWWSAFEVEVKGEVRHWTEDGNLVAEARYLGRHVGPFCGVAPTQRPVDLRLAVVIGFRDGLMAGERFYYDRAGLFAQLGVTVPDGIAA